VTVDPALTPAPATPAWWPDAAREVADILVAASMLRDAVAPQCSLRSPELDKHLAILGATWVLSRRAVHESAEQWLWTVIGHLHAHAKWGPELG